MSVNENSLIGSEVKTKPNMNFTNTKSNMDLFDLMISICQKNQSIPLTYVEDMIKMRKKCSVEQQNSKNLRKLIIEAIDGIPENNNAFQYAATVYNEFLHLTKNNSTSLEVENCVASTSNRSANMSLELDNETDSNTINENTKIFNEFIEKCYQNENFPKSNIEVIDKLYRSLPSEFLDTKHFSQLLKESNQFIWPDSNASLYVHVMDVYNQLLQFECSMKVQDRKIHVENNEAFMKKNNKLRKLVKALKTIRNRICILDKKEMDIDNEDEFDENSPYILKDRYEKRIVQIYKRICKISEEPDFLEESDLRFQETNNKLVNKTIEKFYNVNKLFPDYYEIYTLLKLLRDKKKLNWTESELKNISQDAFLKLGKQLKLKRLNEYFNRISYLATEVDPAEKNVELKNKLDESNEKLHADLNALTEKYTNIQDYAEETEGSSLNNTDCENSSDDDSSNKNQPLKKNLRSINTVPIKRKRVLSNKLEKNEPPKKSQKTIYMESFNLTPCSVALEPLNNLVYDETNVNAKKVIDTIATKEITNDNVQSKKTSDDLENVTNDISESSNHISSNNNEKVTDDVLNIVTENSKNNDENLGSYNSAAEMSFVDTDRDGTLVIDEGIHIDDDTDEIIPTKLLENKTSKIECDKKSVQSTNISLDNEDCNPIITEPEVIVHESENLGKDVIEINELDDSDVEITSFETPKVPVQNKKTLESLIKSMNFHKKFNFDQAQRPIQRPPIQRFPSISIQRPLNSEPSHGLHNHHSYNQRQNNPNHNFVNRWIINSVQPQRSNHNRNRPPFNNRLSSVNQRMQQSTFIRSTTRHVTQRISNSVQQQNNFLNNQQVQQRFTTMTTTTTVRQIVQESAGSSGRRQLNTPTNHNRRPVSFRSNTNDNPELIELD